MLKVLVLAVLAVAHGAYYEDTMSRIIPEVLARQSTWTAGYNAYFAGMTKEQVKAKMGTRLDAPPGPSKYVLVKDSLPSTFDARQKWSNCPNIGFIRDQANCGSCWAVAAAETITDRTCIATGNQVYISDEDILSCCTNCGDGCEGGYPIQAMSYWQTTGVVTGGPYGSHQGCQPYAIKPCPASGCSGNMASTPRCQKTCESGYSVSYATDKHKAKSHYYVRGGVQSMQQEIFTNGPIEVAFTVYEDFMSYKSGVYIHTTGEELGGHAVKAIGWGTENGVDYWIIANSWNTTWGDSGFFKIQRGKNMCGIESQPVAGLTAPAPSRSVKNLNVEAPVLPVASTPAPSNCSFDVHTSPGQQLCALTVNNLSEVTLSAATFDDCCRLCKPYKRCTWDGQTCTGVKFTTIVGDTCETFDFSIQTLDNPSIRSKAPNCVQGGCL